MWVLPRSLKRHKKKRGGVVEKSLASKGIVFAEIYGPLRNPGERRVVQGWHPLLRYSVAL